ncbi:MAG: hypothetical protein ACP5C3_08855 [Methanomicrobiales archaeon]
MARDFGESIEKKYAEKALDRKAKATVQSNIYDCSVKSAKFRLKKESTIKKVKCKKCGKIFKTNKDTEYCFKCSKTLNKK